MVVSLVHRTCFPMILPSEMHDLMNLQKLPIDRDEKLLQNIYKRLDYIAMEVEELTPLSLLQPVRRPKQGVHFG